MLVVQTSYFPCSLANVIAAIYPGNPTKILYLFFVKDKILYLSCIFLETYPVKSWTTQKML